LKKKGKIRFVGASIGDDDPNTALELVASGFADQIQVLFNLFDQRAADKLFPLCKAKKVAVVVRCRSTRAASPASCARRRNSSRGLPQPLFRRGPAGGDVQARRGRREDRRRTESREPARRR